MKLTRSNLACLIGVATLESKQAVMGFVPHSTSGLQPRREFSIFASFIQDLSYTDRQASFEMADKEVLAETARMNDAIFMDARSLEEIAEESLDIPFVHGNFILRGQLSHLHQILPSKSAHIIVFCKMGGRAQRVKDTLEENGYKNILNAGGIGDIDFLPEK